MLSVSGVHCDECLSMWQQLYLPPEIGMSIKGSGQNFRFLNSVVLTSEHEVALLPFNINAEFAVGTQPDQETARIQPALGNVSWSSARMRSYVRQRLAVHRHLVPVGSASGDMALQAADWLVALELGRLGYSQRAIEARWNELPPLLNDPPSVAVREKLREYRKMKIPFPPPPN